MGKSGVDTAMAAAVSRAIKGVFRSRKRATSVVPLPDEEGVGGGHGPQVRKESSLQLFVGNLAEKASQYLRKEKSEPPSPGAGAFDGGDATFGSVSTSSLETLEVEEAERQMRQPSKASTRASLVATASEIVNNKRSASKHSSLQPPQAEALSNRAASKRSSSSSSLRSEVPEPSRRSGRSASKMSVCSAMSMWSSAEYPEDEERRRIQQLLKTADSLGSSQQETQLAIYERTIILLEALQDTKKVQRLEKKCQTLRRQIVLSKVHRDDGGEQASRRLVEVMTRKQSKGVATTAAKRNSVAAFADLS
eukprot:TRINITY_DN10935_c0_g1_i1.p1 TRINITY_DN10935_c0_g1~~TRINITY_DN10935_c0_g1_i1.p1  ORF type:complete len:307 (+),score=73.11 TRINITY_DN10935_c0_g1_i1:184-1104(+)